ncbi:MAG: hypothetical protein KGJ23_14560 [Euryarchaeota archaeon]|nr:hypothetical protein [Euryarchaeota archaeon]MDE1837822.1 hypothetical protein [Euryarchaeota archaeon]MDE1880096.1 hypothetical protein [Euryarchaeota archaeon]MDE2045066.1 hypothetical protein [Thermoplasmata archaeon]
MSIPFEFVYAAAEEFDGLAKVDPSLQRELNELRRRVCRDPLHPPPPPVVKRLVHHPGFWRVKFGVRPGYPLGWRAIYRFDNAKVEFWVIGPRGTVYRRFEGMHTRAL